MFLKIFNKSGKGILFFLLFYLTFTLLIKANPTEEKIVLAQVQAFLDAHASHRSDIASSLLLEEGMSFSVMEENGKIILEKSLFKEYIEGLESSKNDLLERVWGTKVLVHENIAMVWAPYDFHRNREFIHCGVNVFTLIKTTQGWKIASIAYTVKKNGCEESPLGPIRK